MNFPCRAGLWLVSILYSAGVLAAGNNVLDAGSPPPTPYSLGGDWFIGGRLEAEYLGEANYNLNDRKPDDLERLTLLHPSLAISWWPAGPWSAYLNLEYQKHHFLVDEGESEKNDAELLVDKLHVDYQGESLHMRLGRQRVKDPREWMIDDTLDGLRVLLRRPDYQFQGALLRERGFTKDLLNDNDEKKGSDNLWLRLEAPATAEFRHAVFLMLQRDRERDEQAAWLGIDMQGAWEDLDYWFQGAVVHGDHRGKTLKGYGFDVGGVYRLRKRPRVYAIAGFAFGSGNRNDVDLGFRQTDLQDNTAKLGGVVRMAYYGELFDPELGNLAIATLGIGMRPVRKASLNLVWHHYRQHHPLDELRESDLDTEPNGESRNIGSEIDLVFGYRVRGRFKLEAVLGRFLPGSAFDRRDPATLVGLKVRYNF